jgi:hypothetical protein
MADGKDTIAPVIELRNISKIYGHGEAVIGPI